MAGPMQGRAGADDHKSPCDESAAWPGLRLVVASDHRGHAAKLGLLEYLKGRGCEATDLGCGESANCDYPDYAAPAARLVVSGEAHAAILLDGGGIGMAIVANKVRGARAATAHDEITARYAREHNHCNVLCVGTDLVSERSLSRIVEVFLTTPFAEGRHVRRVTKIAEIEEQESRPAASMRMSS